MHGSALEPRSAAPAPIVVSVLIKALNEERHIERSVRSALKAISASGRPGEVILADSLSTDATVDIASRFPIRIVQLVSAQDRCCGVGAQLGFQIAQGEFIYILDGDMELEADFLPEALRVLEADPMLAGVAGLVQEMHVENIAFRNRAVRSGTTRPGNNLPSLDMGGLYRRLAIQEAGYLTDRNLHAFEEFELGARLNVGGWRLRRLDLPSVRHYGHTDTSFALLWRRWRSRYAFGHGELLRGAFLRPHLWFVLTRLRVYRLQLGLLAAWLLALLAAWLSPAQWSTLVVLIGMGYGLALSVMSLRKRSLQVALYSLLSWHVGLAGLLRGLLVPRRADPSAPLPYRVLQ